MKICENCNQENEGTYGSGRFCSVKCARGFGTKEKRKEINEKVSKKLMGRILSNEIKEKMSLNHGRYWEGKKRENIKGYNNSSKYKGILTAKSCKKCGEKCSILVYGSICDSCKGSYRVYRESCSFKFNVFNYPDLFDLSLIEKYGIYSPKNSKNPNLKGISRDHRISIKYGFENNIDPSIISHPLNCKLLIHTDNQKKNRGCSISVEKIIDEIYLYEKNK
jgi:hypothetical protein